MKITNEQEYTNAEAKMNEINSRIDAANKSVDVIAQGNLIGEGIDLVTAMAEFLSVDAPLKAAQQ